MEKSIIFLGKLDEKNLFNTILKSKLLIYPSYVDSFSLTVAETLSLGIPVLAYETDAMRFEWGQNKSILRVKVGNYETMGKKLAQIMKDDNVDAIKTIAEKESIDVVRRFSWDNVIKAERGFYEWVSRIGY
jgi:glycosyltransferase involved in cell wall biosynthesis